MSDLFQRLFSLAGKTALVTGASGGIGHALAVAFAEAGATVGIHGTRRDKLSETAAAIASVGGKSVALPAQLGDAAAARQLIADAHTRLGRIDILVNCAGTNRRNPIRDVTEADFDLIAAVNLKSLFFLSQAAAAVMKAQGGGRIINVGSITTTDGLGGVSVYGATKAAVGQLTRTMALEWAPDNIQVNCLAPGFIFTPLTAVGLWGDPHRKQWILDRVALRRPGQPDELIGAALLLAAPAGSYLTGQILNVDGGYLAGGSWLREGE